MKYYYTLTGKARIEHTESTAGRDMEHRNLVHCWWNAQLTLDDS